MLGIGLLVGFCFLVITIVRRKRAGGGIALLAGGLALVFLVAFGLAASLVNFRQSQGERGVGLMQRDVAMATRRAEAKIQRAMAKIQETLPPMESARQDYEDNCSVVIQGPPTPIVSWDDSSRAVRFGEDSMIVGNPTACLAGDVEHETFVEGNGEGNCQSAVHSHSKTGGKNTGLANSQTTARVPSLPIQVGVLVLMILLAYLFVDARGRRRYTWARRITAAAAFTVVCLCLM